MNLKEKIMLSDTDMDGYAFDTLTEVQHRFIDTVYTSCVDDAVAYIKAIEGAVDLSRPMKLLFCWQGDKDNYRFEISEREDFSDSRIIECKERSIEITNLKNGRKYFWRIDGGKVHFFETVDNKWRFINIDGVGNARDVGGRKIKEGLLYRGSEVYGPTFKITSDGIKTMRDELKIKTVLDLRVEWLGRFGDSTPVPGVGLKQIPYRPYIEVFEEKHRQEIKEIFEFLSEEENYPIYFHCMGGADRTGMIAFYLEALAGESEEDIFLDYELTSLSRIYNPQTNVTDAMYRKHIESYFVEFLDELETYAPKGTLREQVRAFLVDCGVTDMTLDKICDIIRK